MLIQGDAESYPCRLHEPDGGGGLFQRLRSRSRHGTFDDMNWEDIPLTSGSFQSGSGSDQISGQFYGPNHEEVGGVFERNQILGAFGAKRE